MMFFDGYIGAPPTVTLFSAIVSAERGMEAIAATARRAPANKTKRLDMRSSIFALLCDRDRRRTAGDTPEIVVVHRDTVAAGGGFTRALTAAWTVAPAPGAFRRAG